MTLCSCYHQNSQSSCVLLPCLIQQGRLQAILVCRKPDNDNRYPGQWCFPGGHVEPSDASLKHTALRECYEETSITAHSFSHLQAMSSTFTRFGSPLHAYVGLLQAKPDIQLNHELVAYRWVSISELQEARRWSSLKKQEKNIPFTLPAFFLYDNEYVWGLTGRFLWYFTRCFLPQKASFLSHPGAHNSRDKPTFI